jgi:hypothetical protein
MLIIWGHDEAIVKQFTLTKKGWTGPNGEIPIVPKDEGMGIMISAFQCREFGFGLPIEEEQLKTINATREGQKYKDEVAAKQKRGSEQKTPLTSSPFAHEFRYGANEQGYWCYDHMVLQLEDCRDCLRVLYPDIEFLFMFDHSCGHDRQKENGLRVENMSKSFGGKQTKLRETRIMQEQGYLGKFP